MLNLSIIIVYPVTEDFRNIYKKRKISVVKILKYVTIKERETRR